MEFEELLLIVLFAAVFFVIGGFAGMDFTQDRVQEQCFEKKELVIDGGNMFSCEYIGHVKARAK